MVKETEYYERLRVSPESPCTPEELTRSWMQIAREKNPNMIGDLRTEKLKKIAEAYQVLKDPYKREIYDQFGKEAFETRSNATKKRANPISYTLHVTMEELQQGVTKSFMIPTCKICRDCDGTGILQQASICMVCYGIGSSTNRRIHPRNRIKIRCAPCLGTGRVTTYSCEQCKGVGVKISRKLERVTLTRFMQNGQRIVVKNYGNEFPGVERGHVELTIHIRAGVASNERAVNEPKEVIQLDSSSSSDEDERNTERENEGQMQHKRVEKRKSSSNDDGTQEKKAESHISQIVSSRNRAGSSVLSSPSDRATVDKLSTVQSEVDSAKTLTSFSQQSNASNDLEDQDSDVEVVFDGNLEPGFTRSRLSSKWVKTGDGDWKRKVVILPTRRENNAEVSDALNQSSSQKKKQRMDPTNSS